jgi:hypothetical protein
MSLIRPPKYVLRRTVTFSTPSVPILAKFSAKEENPETQRMKQVNE